MEGESGFRHSMPEGKVYVSYPWSQNVSEIILFTYLKYIFYIKKVVVAVVGLKLGIIVF